MNIEQYLEELSSKKATPGGGSATALLGFLGISLLQMAIALTQGKKEYASYQSLYEEVNEALKKAKEKVSWGMHEDEKAFYKVMELYRKKPLPEERDTYEKELHDAYFYAGEVPLRVARALLEAVREATRIHKHIQPWAMSDFIAGIELIVTAIRTVLLNTAINMKSMGDSQERELLYRELVRIMQERHGLYDMLEPSMYEKKTFQMLR